MPAPPLLPVTRLGLALLRVTGFVVAARTEVSFFDGLSDSLLTYVLLGASTIITEELSPIFGGIAAHEGELRLDRVLIALILGGWIATTLLYAIGRAKWDYIRRRWPSTRAPGTVALRIVARNPGKASALVRFAFGLRMLLPVACGAARVPVAIYLPASLLGSIVWSSLFVLIGYAAGEAAVSVIGRLGRVGEVIGALVVTAVVLLFLRWNTKRNERREARLRRRRLTDA